MAKIKTFAEACKALKIKASAVPDFSKIPLHHRKALEAHYKLVVITEALNEGWKPDWKDYSEDKYYPWFKNDGFSFDGVGGWFASSAVGSRLCFKSEELAKYAGKKFIKLYKDYFLLPK